MKKHGFGILFMVCIVLISVINIFSVKQTQSNRENRQLALFPTFSLSNFFDTTFQNGYEEYVNDQFYQREAMLEVKNTLENTMRIQAIGDVFIGTDKQLIQAQYPVEKEYIEELALQMNTFAKNHEDVKMMSMIVPNKGTILADAHLDMAPIHDQSDDLLYLKDQLSTFYNIDVTDNFKEQRDENLYYRSDHHWTTKGAYLAFQIFLKQQGQKESVDYEPILINDRFYGTLANATGLNVYDDLYLYEPKEEEIQCIVNYVEEQKKTTSVYDIDKQYAQNPYEVFLSGNHPFVEISTTSEENRSLLILKDSYANSFIPFLLPYYHKILVIDPRYYYENLDQLMRLHNVNEVLFLYNANTFFTDTSLFELLQEE